MIEAKNLELKEARKIIDAMVEYYAVTKPGRPGSHAVVDNGGVPICFARMDGASHNTAVMAMNKAYTAVKWNRDTSAIAEMFKKSGNSIFSFGDPRYTQVPGGCLVKSSDGSIVGAVGSSGRTADEDEEVCLVGAKVL